ncbi:MAG: DUF7408 domain-containing protein [Armatimonadota bacterium]
MNIFYARPSNNGFYGIPEALGELPGSGIRLRTSLFRSTQFPLTYPLPKRLDRDMQGWFGLQAYDLLILAGLDPEVLSPKEMRDIVAFVEHGGGLFVLGGEVSGGNRIGTWEPLSSVLPVALPFAPDLAVDTAVTLGEEHWITAGIPLLQGKVQAVHAAEPQEGSRVLLQAAGQPLLVECRRGKGRVLFLNSYPQAAQTAEGLLFTDRFFGDLLRRCCAWLTKGQTESMFTALSVPETAGGTLKLTATGTSDGEAIVTAVLKDGDSLLCAESKSLVDMQPLDFTLAVPDAAGLPEQLTVTLAMQDGAQLLDFRATTVQVMPQVSFSIEFEDGFAAIAPGMELRTNLAVHTAPVIPYMLKAQIIDPHGAVLHEREVTAGPLAWIAGDLASGDYTLQVQAADQSGKVLCAVSRTFAIVDPLDNEHFFPFVSEAFPEGGKLTVNEADLRRMIDDVAGHGFNTIMLGHVHNATPLTNAAQIRRGGERYVQELGLRLATHGNTVPSFSRSAPPEDCIRDAAAFGRSLRERVLPLLEAGKRVPRLFMMEILDEPLLAPKMICRCPLCLRDFQERYGYEMPDWMEACAPGREAERTDLLQFSSDYWADIFKRCYEYKGESGAAFDVHHTFCQLTFGSFTSRYYWRDGFNWMPYCDRFDWDVYPYIYIAWRAHRELRNPNMRYHISGHRSLARYHNKPMGHWLDLSDRNVPHWNPPVRASSELLYTAIGQDAKLVRTFYNITFGRNNGPRKERWDDLGAELNKIGRYASALSLAKKPHAKLAMVFPATDWALRHHTDVTDLPAGIPVSDFPLKFDDAPFDDWFPYAGPLYNAFELLLRVFGEADLLPEQMAAMPAELTNHRALALWHAKFLSKAAAEALKAFVHEGGLLICDGIPELDERGKPLEGLAELFGANFQPLCDELSAARKRVGKGETLLFNLDVNRTYSDAAVAGDRRMMQAMEGTIRDFLTDHEILPHARPTNTEFEVDVLAGQDCFFLVAVNHNEVDDETVVELLDLPSPVGYAVDLNTGLDVPVESGQIRLPLGERKGTIIGCYPERPVKNAVRIVEQQGRLLTYEVSVLNAAGTPAAGHHPVEIIVRDPSGSLRTRYGGRRATTGGVYCRTVTLATNELPGEWQLEVRDPITRTISSQRFTVA